MTHLMIDGNIKVIKIIKVNKKYIVYFNNNKNLNLSMEQLINFRINLDKSMTHDEFKKIEDSCIFFNYYEKVLKYISLRLRTKKEILTYLDKSDLSISCKSNIVNKLIENNYINDELYVKYFLNSCIDKNKGVNYFVHRLKALDVDINIINKYTSTFNDQNVIHNLVERYQKELNNLSKYPIYIQKQKIINKMNRNGISANIIDLVVNSLDYKEDISELFLKDLNKIKNKTIDKNKQIEYLLSRGYSYNLIREYIK